MKTLCGLDCNDCMFKDKCKGCAASNGHPFGGDCIGAEFIKINGKEAFFELKKRIITDINDLKIDSMPEITELYCLCGSIINLEYTLPNGIKTKFFDDQNIYLGAQVEPTTVDATKPHTFFGLVAGIDFLLVSKYEEEGKNPKIVLYKER